MPCLGVTVCSHLPLSFHHTHTQRASTRVYGGAGGDGEDWKNIVGSEANLRNYLGGEGFRYCLNKTPQELEKEGDYNLFEKMFGATSNNEARFSARAYGRALTIDTYDSAKAAENKEWIAKYGYKRWGTSYLDKSDLEKETPASKPVSKPASKPTANKPAFSFPSFGGGGAKAAPAPAKKTSAVKVTAAAPKAAAPAAPKAAKPKAAAPPSGPLSGKPQAQGKGNVNLFKKPGSS